MYRKQNKIADVNPNIIILSGLDGLYSPIKRKRLSDWIKKKNRFNCFLSTRDTFQIQNHNQFEINRMEKRYSMQIVAIGELEWLNYYQTGVLNIIREQEVIS